MKNANPLLLGGGALASAALAVLISTMASGLSGAVDGMYLALIASACVGGILGVIASASAGRGGAPRSTWLTGLMLSAIALVAGLYLAYVAFILTVLSQGG